MPKLKKIHKELIVSSLAENNTSKEVQEILLTHFNIKVPLNQISFYNPEITSSAELSDTWRSLYWHKKEEYRMELASHPTTDKAYRIGMLDKAAHKYLKEEQYMAMAKILEQIAKEVGRQYEDKDQVKGGGEGEGYTSIQAIMHDIDQLIIKKGLLKNDSD